MDNVIVVSQIGTMKNQTNLNKTMNKNIQALQDYTEAFMNPKSISTFEGMSKFIGAINQIQYGINPHESKNEQERPKANEPADEQDPNDYEVEPEKEVE